MNNIFHDLLDNAVTVYLDNILIYTESIEKDIPLVQAVLSRLYEPNLGVNLKKSAFHIEKVKFLSYIIPERGIEMSQKKMEEVWNSAVRRKVKDVQEFPEFANFYRRFIQEFTQIAVPLTALTPKDEP